MGKPELADERNTRVVASSSLAGYAASARGGACGWLKGTVTEDCNYKQITQRHPRTHSHMQLALLRQVPALMNSNSTFFHLRVPPMYILSHIRDSMLRQRQRCAQSPASLQKLCHFVADLPSGSNVAQSAGAPPIKRLCPEQHRTMISACERRLESTDT